MDAYYDGIVARGQAFRDEDVCGDTMAVDDAIRLCQDVKVVVSRICIHGGLAAQK